MVSGTETVAGRAALLADVLGSGNVLGEALVSFDLASGNATVLNPLQFNLNRPKAPADMGQTAFDAEGQRMSQPSLGKPKSE